MNAVDTNILVYARDPRDQRKQEIAIDLIGELENGILLWQVACEYLSACRKLVPFGVEYEDAKNDIQDLRSLWRCAVPVWSVLDRAFELKQRYGFSHWDSLIVAHCLHIGVKRLYTEDFGDAHNIEGLEIINPFSA